MKKFVSMLVVLAMVLSMVPAVFADEVAMSGTFESVAGSVCATDDWTAESDGVLTISVSSEEGAGYKVYINGEAQSLMWAMTYAETVSYEVKAGDRVHMEVRGYNPDSWMYCDATIDWAFTFDAEGVVKEPYAIVMQGEDYWVISAEGEHQVAMIDSADVTVVTFSPEETGVYTITVGGDATIGNCGNTSALINTNVDFGSSVEWTCTSAGYWTETEIPDEDWESTGNMITIEQYISGQSLMLGIISDNDTVTVSVEKTADYVAPTTTEVTYENKAELTPFEIPADATIGEYVDVYGDTHTAVLGNDGYYHLDSADGDILLVDMDYIYDLTTVLNSERPVMYIYEFQEDGSTIRYDIAEAVRAYKAICDENGYCYLTEDLIFFYEDYAANQGVYSYYLNAGYNADCAWMYACLTMALPEAEDTVAGSGTEEDPYIITSLPYTIEVSYADEDQAGTGVFFAYTPEVNGTISIADFENETNMGILTEVEGWVHVTDTNELEVTAGTQILLNHWAMWAGDYDLTLEFTESTGDDDNTGDDDDTGDDDTGDDDTEVTPDSGEWSGTDVAVAADEVITIVYTPETNGTLSVAVSCETGWQVNVNSEFTSESYWSDGSDTPDAIKLTAGTTYTIEIVPYDQADGWTTCDAVMTYELTWTAESTGTEVEGSGTDEDPYVLVIDGYNHASVADGKGVTVWYIFEATEDGTLVLTFDESDPEPWITPYIGGIGGGNGQRGWAHNLEVTAGTTVMLCVESYDFVAAEYDFYASFETSGDDSGDDPEVEAVELYDGENYLSIWAGEGTTPYTYTATQTGTLYLTFTEFAYENSWGYSDCSDYMESYFGMDEWGNENWMMLTINGVMADTYYGSVEVTAGDVVAIGWEYYGANDYVQSNNNMYATLDLNYEGFVIPEPGSIDAPYEMSLDDVNWGMGTTAEVAAGATVYYNMGGFDSSTITFTGEGDFTVSVLSYAVDENWNEIEVWTDYESVDGVVEFVVSGYYVLISIENNSDAAAAYEVGYYYPVGHVNNPEVITGEGSWTATLPENSNGYYYSWSMGDDSLTGIMTITVNGESWQWNVSNEFQGKYGDTHSSNDDGVAAEDWTVFAGDMFTICVTTAGAYDDFWNYTSPAGDVTITITFEAQELVQGVDYPYEIYADETPAEFTVAPGAETWITGYGFYAFKLTVAGEGAYVVYNGETYTDDDGDGIVKVAIGDYTANIKLGNSSNAEVTYTVGCEIPVGHSKNPDVITEDGTYTTSEFPGNGFYNYYFQYTAAENGTITVEVLNEDLWRIQLYNPATYSSAGGNCNDDTNVFTLKVSAGDVIQIYGATYDPSIYDIVEGILSFNFSFEKEELNVDDAIALVDGDNAIGMDNLDSTQTPAVFTYTATQSGTLYLTLSEVYYSSYSSWDDTMSEPYEGREYLIDYTHFLVNREPLANGYYGAIEVEAGDEITITWNMKYNYMWVFTANLNLSYEGYNPAPGSAADPIEVSFYDCYKVPVETIEIAAGGTAHYILQGFYGYALTITGEGAYMIYNGVTYTAENGVIELMGDDYEMFVEIGNSGDTAAVFTIGGAFPVGEMMNPEIIVDGEYTADMEENDDNYFFAYYVNCEGILDITVSGDSWTFMIYNETTGLSYFDGEWGYMGGIYASSEYGEETTVSIDVYPGDVIQIAVNTEVAADDPEGLWSSSPAGTVTLNVAAEYFHVDDDGDGCCDDCGESLLDVVLGDLNGDGEVDIFDANLVVGYYNGTAELTDEQLVAADVNGDGEVDIFDANLIVSYYNGTIASFPAEED